MNTTTAPATAPHLHHTAPKCARLTLALLVGLATLPAWGQGVYRSVGPDGRITFSDQPTADASMHPVGGAPTSANTGPAANATLPFALRQVVNRYPVTLYTSSTCTPCNSGRNWLNRRGVPYTEKTVNTPHDAEALHRMSGQVSLPFLTIGSQQIRGFSEPEWTQFIDAAGYPQQSALPPNYRRAPATPLVEVEVLDPTASAPDSGAKPTPTAPAVPITPPTVGPSGIRF